MAGYYKNKMSNNAVDAYASGEMPESKWTKKAILEEINDIFYCEDEKTEIDFKKLTLKELKAEFLMYSAWHHTSALYNSTEFYYIDKDLVLNFTINDLKNVISKRKKRTYTRRTKEELEKIKAEKEKDKLLIEKSKEIYRKLYIIWYSDCLNLKTFEGVENRFLNGKIDIDVVYVKSLEAIKKDDVKKIECWRALPADHWRQEYVKLYDEDIDSYAKKLYHIHDYQISKKDLKKIKERLKGDR